MKILNILYQVFGIEKAEKKARCSTTSDLSETLKTLEDSIRLNGYCHKTSSPNFRRPFSFQERLHVQHLNYLND